MHPGRWAVHLLMVLMGVAVGVAAVAVHRISVASLPLGLILALLATFAVAGSLDRIQVPSRLATSYAGGWVLAFALALKGRPEGDFLVASDGVGYTLMASAFVLIIIGVLSGARPADSRSRRTPT